MLLFSQSQNMVVRFLLSASAVVLLQVAGAIGSHIFYSTVFHPLPQSMLRQKTLPVMTRLWSPWASFLLFLDRGIEVALFREIYHYQMQNRAVSEDTWSYLDSYPLPAGVSVLVLLVVADQVWHKILARTVPGSKTGSSYAAVRMLGIDFVAPRLAFFVVLGLLWQTTGVSSTLVGSAIVWLMVRSCYAETNVFEQCAESKRICTV